jgi:hypothetical protein
VERPAQHVKFFRIRSPLILRGEGSQYDDWLAQSILYLDFSVEDLLSEYYVIAVHSKGGFTFDNVRRMTMKQYEYTLNEARKIAKAIEEHLAGINDGTGHSTHI